MKASTLKVIAENGNLRAAIADLEAYRRELIERGQGGDLEQEYVRVVADRLGVILRPLYD